MPNKVALTAACLMLLVSVGFGQTVEEASSLASRDFETRLASGTNLRLHLHTGDFRVLGSDSEKLSIHAEGKNAKRAKNIKIRVRRSAERVDLTLLHVPKNDLLVTIRIPAFTNLYARMRGGDLSVEHVRGDKDVELTGGDLTVQVPDREEYSQVDLSVRFGDISGNQFGDPRGWLGNSVRKVGTGKYRLHVHVMAGDLILKS